MVIIAHRGFHDGKRIPPNSLTAFRRAALLGVDGVEFDVRRTADGVVIVHHDRSPLPRVTKENLVQRLTHEMMMRLHVEYHPSDIAADAVPTLDQAIDALPAPITLHIEIKCEDVRSDGIESAVLEILERRRVVERTILSTFNPFTLRRLRRLAPDVRTALLFHGKQSRPFRKAWAATALKPFAVHPERRTVDADSLEKWHERGYRVHPWTVNDRAEMRRLAKLGVDGIITDRPDVAIELLR
ncbi:MAG: glycerophosphodiester phosphodiesterase [Deltaproteobacteria bacterium]|nr:glycerophosphodiester phosphodiesterase [Deltaproteobacteria bacterium]